MADTDRNNRGDGPDNTPENARNAANSGPLAWNTLFQLINERKIDFALWVTRLLTMIFAAGYVFPIFANPVQCYYKAFMASAATSALRLHQRLPNFTISRAYFQQMVQEDSFHYLFCSLIFLYATPLTLSLAPSFLFALLHFASFSLNLLDALGRNSAWIARVFISLIEYKSVTMLRMAAGAEIFIMWFLVMYSLIGRLSLLTPFLYFRFLTFRYASRRNHYTRTMFYEFRILLERAAEANYCPYIVKRGIQGVIQLACKFAPPYAPAPTN